ncbi:MAG: zinc-binding dehydrogenase, partial [Pseudomonadota bacterium]
PNCGANASFSSIISMANVQPGENCVIVGVGGVGMNAVQGAAIAGARAVIAMDIMEEKLALAPQFGATHMINSAKQEPVAAVQGLTNGRGADHVLVAVGAAHVMEQAMALCRPGGVVTLLGMPPTGSNMQVDVGSFSAASKSLRGAKMGSTRLDIDVPYLIDLYSQGRLELDALVSQCYDFADINKAIATIKAGRNLRNVLIMAEA